jgi:hypothetical protein
MGWVCLFVTPLLQLVQNHISQGNKKPAGTPERFAGSYDISLYADDLKRDLHRGFYTLLMNLCLEKRWIIYYPQ